MAKTKHGLPETKGQFKLRGLASGTQRENFYKPITTKTNKKMNILNFGVDTKPESTVYVTVQGMEREEVYFSKRSEVQGQPAEVKKVPWNERFEDQGEGFNIIGVTVGIKQDDDGKNISDTYTEYDAAEEILADLKDGQPLFVRGDIEYSSFINSDGDKRRNKKFNARNIYGSKEINFDADDFEEVCDFKQKIIFIGVEKADDKNDPHFIVEAKIVTYSSVEDADFVVRDVSLANTFRSQLKPYTAIDIWGNIFNKVDSEDIEESKKAVWGADDSFKKLNKNYIRELVIIGADPETIDAETYSEEKIEEALKALNEFGSTNAGTSWGNKNVDIKDEDLPW